MYIYNSGSLRAGGIGIFIIVSLVLTLIFSISLVQAEETAAETTEVVEVEQSIEPEPVVEETVVEEAVDEGSEPESEPRFTFADASEIEQETTPEDEVSPVEPEETTPEPVVEETVVEEVVEEESESEPLFTFAAATVGEEEVTPEEDTPPTEPEETTPLDEPEESTVVTETAIEDGDPELTTDKDDYRPGETATIFGRFFSPLMTFIIKVFGSDDNEENYTETVEEIDTDGEGLFSFDYVLDDLYRPFYEVVVSTLEGDKVAETWFRDAAVGTYDQCANDDGDGYNGDPGDCNWINGNLNINNSTYFEGDSTVQRLWLEGFTPGAQHTVTLQYGTTKAGKHAYDFLTDWDASENWITVADRCDGITGCTGAGEITFPIPDDPMNPFDNGFGPRNFTMRGATIGSVSSGPTLQSGSYAGDSETTIQIQFTVGNSGGTMCSTKKVQGQDVESCGVAVWFGAHIAETEAWLAHDGTTGATTINGSPYHVALLKMDGDSIGNRDNQMQAGAIRVPETGHIVINKVTVGGDGSFDYTGDLGAFQLNTVSNFASTTFANLPGGEYSVTESAEAGWDFTDLSCNDPDGETVTLGTTATIDLDPEETVICTYTNTERGSITIEKQVVGTDADFDFSGDVSGTLGDDDTETMNVAPGQYSSTETTDPAYDLTDITCDDGNSTGDTGTGVATFNVEAGEHVKCVFTNSELPTLTLVKVLPNDSGGDATQDDFQAYIDGNPVDWDTEYTLDPDSYVASEDTLPGYDASDWGDDCSESGSVDLAYGDHKTCEITNDDQQAYITVVKVVNNDHGGLANPNDFNLTLEGNPVSSGVAVPVNPGTHTAAETLLDGYTFNGFSDDCDDSGDTTVALGESKTCTLTNSDQSGTLIVNKVTNPASASTTEFTITASPDGAGAIESPAAEQTITGGSQVIYTVAAGTYDVDEDSLDGWVETSNTCNDVVVPLGGQGECTITNTQNGHIIIKKNAINDSDQEFTFQNNFGNGNPASFGLTDDNTPGLPFYDAEVTPGSYSVSEDEVDNWQLEALVCDDDDSVEDIGNRSAAIEVSAGETVTCTFTNEELSKITLVKETTGGNDTFNFEMTGSGLPANTSLTTIAGTDNEVFEGLDQDNSYSFAEVNIPDGWALTSATCDNGDPVNNVTPNAGEEITCTFTNSLPGAQIDVTPLSAYNAVNDPHEVTATVQVHDGDGVYGPAADGTEVTFTLENNNNGSTFVGGVDTCLTSGGSCSVSINTANTGSVEIHAAASPQVIGVNIDVETDGIGDNSENGEKTYVNARIAIETTDTNEVDDPHTFTVTVEQNTGSGWDPVESVYPVVTFSPSDPGTVTDDCDNSGTDSNGECTVDINSAVAGVFETNAAVSFSVEGVAFNIETDGIGENSDDATKTYVDASIALTPQTGTNEVDDEHVITATVTEDDGTGPVASAGETVTFVITSGSATFVAGTDNCITNGAGQCSISIVDDTAGLNEIDASVTVSVGGLELDRATDVDAGPDGSDEAEKTYVDARISIGDSETNNVGEEHIFTVHVEENDGTGWADAVGETVDTSLLNNLAGAVYVGSDSCVTNANGECTVTINSAAPGTVDINAESDVMVGGLSLNRETDGSGENSDDATKTYVGAKITIEKVTIGGDGDFNFTANFMDNFSLSDGGATTSGWLPLVGGHSVSESVPDGWDLTDVTCDNGDNEDNITLDTDGETVTCTFTNTKRAKLTIVKDADPDDLQDFAFNLTDGNDVDDDFDLDDDETIFDGDNTLDNMKVYMGATGLVSGIYTVTEELPNEFWEHEGVTCTNDSDDSAFAGASDTELGVILDLEPGDEVTCIFLNTKESPTRTQGFWQTHLEYTTGVFNGQLLGELIIGDPTAKTISSIDELFGAFWSNIAKKTTGKGKQAKRTAEDKARMQLLQQLVAAELNCAAFGCSGSIRDMLDEAHEAYSDGDVGDIIFYVGEVDAFNNSGDTLVVGNTGKADPKTIKQTVDLQFWDDPASEL